MSIYDNQNIPEILDSVPLMDISTADVAATSLTTLYKDLSGHLSHIYTLITNPTAAAGSHLFKLPRFMDDATAGEITNYHVRLRSVRDSLADASSKMRLIFVDGDLE